MRIAIQTGKGTEGNTAGLLAIKTGRRASGTKNTTTSEAQIMRRAFLIDIPAGAAVR